MTYNDFLKTKQLVQPNCGLKNIPQLSSKLFDFQRDIVSWACKRGRASIFAGTGLGKSFQELSWA